MNRDEIVDRVGADDWKMVENQFSEMSLEEIKSYLNFMWPNESIDNLVEAIYNELN